MASKLATEEDTEERKARLEANRLRKAAKRATEDAEERKARLEADRLANGCKTSRRRC